MPTYQYRCTECGHDLEAVQSFSDAALTECPACAGRLRKIFGSVGLVFKGSGFYKTDSRSAVGGSKKERVDASVGEKATSTASSESSGAAREPVAASAGASTTTTSSTSGSAGPAGGTAPAAA